MIANHRSKGLSSGSKSSSTASDLMLQKRTHFVRWSIFALFRGNWELLGGMEHGLCLPAEDWWRK